jgi:titin
LIGEANATNRNVLGGNCHGIYVQGQFASVNLIQGNYIGTTVAGTAADPNEIGIVLINDTHSNIIGNLTASALPANLISGNTIGIQIFDSDSNKISGNYIGTTKAGTVALGNGTGINLYPDSNGNAIGLDGSGKGSGNVISGNQETGIEINSSNNIVSGNFIGTTNTGMAALGNGSYGVYIAVGSGNIIGTNGNGTVDEQEGNVISANGALIAYSGLEIDGNNNVVAGNLIGTNKDGTTALGNKGRGVYITGEANRVGTDSNGVSDVVETNIISGNGNEGVYITSAFNIISGNRIGTDTAGAVALGNQTDGVSIAPSGHFNVIGINGVALPHAIGRNIISANGAGGGNYANVHIEGDYNLVGGNYIGPNAAGSASLGNTRFGVQISNGATGNTIGTNGDGSADSIERNLISGNGYAGVRILEAFDNLIAGNYIGTNAIGLSALPNAFNSTSGPMGMEAVMAQKEM